jgi:predicted ribosome quality control (RQC) complex YloA/Tae2 family protein
VSLRDWETGETLEIILDPRLSPSRNAERYFKKYKKARCDPKKIREEIASIEGAIEEIREQRDLLEAIQDAESFEKAARDVGEWLSAVVEKKDSSNKNTPKNTLPPHLRFEYEGYTILVGLSARGNRYVTFKQASGDDIWLHAHEVSGAHVIIRGARGREGLDPNVLLFAASLAAAHSRAKGEVPQKLKASDSTPSAQVDYTERRYVRAVPGTMSLVTYTNPGTVRVAPRVVQ